jgi:hypothetical protein
MSERLETKNQNAGPECEMSLAVYSCAHGDQKNLDDLTAYIQYLPYSTSQKKANIRIHFSIQMISLFIRSCRSGFIESGSAYGSSIFSESGSGYGSRALMTKN